MLAVVVIVILSFLNSISASIIDENESRRLQAELALSSSYIEPLWWPRIFTSNLNTDVKLERCTKRQKAPMNGTACFQSKTCYFGTQDCDYYGAHPVTKCICSGSSDTNQIWRCQSEPCPTDLPSSTGCGRDGLTNHTKNDALCPTLGPLDEGSLLSPSSCTPDRFGKTCAYGTDKCCGSCFPSYTSTCESNGQWSSLLAASCIFPTCLFKVWTGVQGKSCVEVRTMIYSEYPGMKVICLKEFDVMPTDDDYDRYLVITDPNGIVQRVVFNKVAACPAVSPLTAKSSLACPVPGQQCDYTINSDVLNTTTCRILDSCICNFGQWDCLSDEICSLIPESNANKFDCPTISPMVSNISTCEVLQPCQFSYNSQFEGSTCQNRDSCSCVDGLWYCEGRIDCVPQSPNFALGCPEVSPLVSKQTSCLTNSQKQPCTFQFNHSIPGGTCTDTHTCNCASDKWTCESQTGCVSNAPPVDVIVNSN